MNAEERTISVMKEEKYYRSEKSFARCAQVEIYVFQHRNVENVTYQQCGHMILTHHVTAALLGLFED